MVNWVGISNERNVRTTCSIVECQMELIHGGEDIGWSSTVPILKWKEYLEVLYASAEFRMCNNICATIKHASSHLQQGKNDILHLI